jgi:hypothetical protein
MVIEILPADFSNSPVTAGLFSFSVHLSSLSFERLPPPPKLRLDKRDKLRQGSRFSFSKSTDAAAGIMTLFLYRMSAELIA